MTPHRSLPPPRIRARVGVSAVERTQNADEFDANDLAHVIAAAIDARTRVVDVARARVPCRAGAKHRAHAPFIVSKRAHYENSSGTYDL
jgi:hypothetical protein